MALTELIIEYRKAAEHEREMEARRDVCGLELRRASREYEALVLQWRLSRYGDLPSEDLLAEVRECKDRLDSLQTSLAKSAVAFSQAQGRSVDAFRAARDEVNWRDGEDFWHLLNEGA
jgi:hypothetical protein